MRPLGQVLAAALLVAASYIYGVVSHRDRLFPWPLIQALASPGGAASVPDRAAPGYAGSRGRAKVACATLIGPKTAVLLTLGQSNAANYGEAPYAATQPVLNFNAADGGCYLAGDPLLGATGSGGSPWIRLGDLLVAAAVYDKVVLVPIAVGSSSVVDWAWGDAHARLVAAVHSAQSAGFSITQVLWHQGETDANNGMPGDEYARHLTVVVRSLRALGVQAPIFIAQASLCTGSPQNEDIRAGQRAVVAQGDGVFAGPDTDTLDGSEMRFDGCHFTARGLDAHANQWFTVLTKAAPPPKT